MLIWYDFITSLERRNVKISQYWTPGYFKGDLCFCIKYTSGDYLPAQCPSLPSGPLHNFGNNCLYNICIKMLHYSWFHIIQSSFNFKILSYEHCDTMCWQTLVVFYYMSFSNNQTILLLLLCMIQNIFHIHFCCDIKTKFLHNMHDYALSILYVFLVTNNVYRLLIRVCQEMKKSNQS